MQVHLPREALSELDRLEFTAKCFGEGSLDQTLEPLLELLKSHDVSNTTWANGWRDSARGPLTSMAPGRVAELADAQDSGSCVRKDVGVQVPPRPPTFDLQVCRLSWVSAVSDEVSDTHRSDRTHRGCSFRC